MLAFLRGVLFECTEDSAIIEVNGIAYEVQVHQRLQAVLTRPGEMVTIFTALQVTDSDMRLFGFLDREELAVFKLLTTISGIGAKVAHNVIGTLAPEDFYHAILSGDEKTLLAAPGVGKKMAQRLVFELKDKLAKDQVVIQHANLGDSSAIEDLLQAMEALSYTRSEVMSSVLAMQNQGKISGDLNQDVKNLLAALGSKH